MGKTTKKQKKQGKFVGDNRKNRKDGKAEQKERKNYRGKSKRFCLKNISF